MELTSVTLLERIQQDDSQAWATLVGLYAPFIYARCRSRWRLRAEESENIGQDVFAAVAKSIKDFQRGRVGAFRAWIRTITDNKCRDLLRRPHIDNPVGGSDAQRVLASVPESAGDTVFVEDEVTERVILIRQAMKAVEGEFSSRDWKLFWEVTVEGRNRQDVAADLGVSDNVVYLVLSRIRKKLREEFQELIDADLLSAP